MKILNVFLFYANFLAYPEKFMKRVVISLLASICGITPIASPSKVIPCPENEIKFTLNGFSSF
jgi:hypothetical protein